jgi:surface protein
MDHANNINELIYKEIVIFQFQYQSWKLYSSFGKIISIKDNEFAYTSITPLSSLGYPIFLKDSSKVIGITKISPQKDNYGNFIMPIFNYFRNYNDKNKALNESKELINSIQNEEQPNNRVPAIVNNLIDLPEYYDYISEKKNNFNLNNLPDNKLNQMIIYYNIDEDDDKIRLFCGDFVKNNENNCYLLIDKKKHELCNYLILNEAQKRGNILEIKLIEYKPIINMGFMFFQCPSLVSLPDINNWDTKNITKMNSMFNGCISLQYLPELSKWDTKNVIDMSCMFLGCTSLKYIKGINNWDTRNVTKMNSMFGYCRSLISMPDISNWDTRNVINMNWMFLKCESLINFPDISKWELNNNLQKIMMFAGCQNNIIPEKFKN